MSSFAEVLINDGGNAANKVLTENGAVIVNKTDNPGVMAFTKLVRDNSKSNKTGKEVARAEGMRNYLEKWHAKNLHIVDAPPSRRQRSKGKPVGNFCVPDDIKRNSRQFNLETDTGRNEVKNYVTEMITYAHNRYDNSKNPMDLECLHDVFVLATHKRAVNRGGKAAGGEGERLIWAQMMLEIYEFYPETVSKLMPFAPEYGCWRDLYMLWELACHRDYVKYVGLIRAIIKCIHVEMHSMSNGTNNNTLLSKWFAREGSHYASACYYIIDSNDSIIRDKHRQFMVGSRLNAYDVFAVLFANDPINTTASLKYARMRLRKFMSGFTGTNFETLACANKWSEINPGKVPSRCIKLQTSALLNELPLTKNAPLFDEKIGNRYPDREDRVKARQNYIKFVTETPENMKVSGIEPHEILDKYRTSKNYMRLAIDAQWKNKCAEIVEQIAEMRKTLIAEGKEVPSHLGNLVPMMDVSGSMNGLPMNVSIGLGLMLCAVQEAQGHEALAISFTDIPFAFNLSRMPLSDRIDSVKSRVGYSTNFEAAINLVLDAIAKSCQHKDLIVFTDGQFNVFDRKSAGNWDTCYDLICKRAATLGLTKIPRIIFWNLRGGTAGVQTNDNMQGVQFLQGYSAALLRFVLLGDSVPETEKTVVDNNGVARKVRVSTITPYDTYRAALDLDKYAQIRQIVSSSQEGYLAHRTMPSN